MIMLLQRVVDQDSFVGNSTIMTTGKRFTQRTKDNSVARVIDARAKVILTCISAEPKGKALDAYLRSAMHIKKG